MSHEGNGITKPMEHSHGPTTTRRLLLLGFYDGATDGVLELPDGSVFRFDLNDGEESFTRASRIYSLRPMPPNSLDRITAIISPHIPPHWPAWMPVWSFPDEATQLDVEARLDAILEEAGPVEWEIETDKTMTFELFHSRRPMVASADTTW